MFKRNFFFPKKTTPEYQYKFWVSNESQIDQTFYLYTTVKANSGVFFGKETYFWRWMVPRSRRLEQTEVCLQLRVWGHQSTVRQFLLVLAPLVLLISHPKRNIYQSHVAMKYLYSTLLNEFCQFGNSWDKHYKKIYQYKFCKTNLSKHW